MFEKRLERGFTTLRQSTSERCAHNAMTAAEMGRRILVIEADGESSTFLV